MPIAATKHSVLVAQINQMMMHGRHDDLAIKRLSREIEQVFKVDRHQGYLLRLGFFTLCRDETNVRETVKKLEAEYGVNSESIHFIHTSLLNLGFIDEATRLLLDVWPHMSGDKKLALLISESLPLIGLLGAMADLFPEFAKFGEETDFSTCEMISKFGLATNLKDRDMNVISIVAEGVLRSYKDGYFVGRALRLKQMVLQDEAGEKCLHTAIGIPVHTDDELEMIVDMNELMDQALVAEINNPALGHFVTEFKGVEHVS